MSAFRSTRIVRFWVTGNLLETTKVVFSLPNAGYARKEDSLTKLGKMLDLVKSVKPEKS